MNFFKVIFENTYSLPIAPTSYDDYHLDTYSQKRAVTGDLLEYPGILKRAAKWTGLADTAQLDQLETYYTNKSVVQIRDVRNRTFNCRITSFNKRYHSRAVAEYNITIEAV